MSEKVSIFQSGKFTVVAGMMWRPLGTDPRAETRAAARMMGTRYGLVVQTASNGLLSGFLPAMSPVKARTAYSGAIWIANAIKTPTIYIRNLPNGEFWVVAATPGNLDVRSDQILPEEQTKQLIDQFLSESMGGASQDNPHRLVIDGDRKPASLMIDRHESVHLSFDDLIAGVAPDKADRVTQLVGVKPGQILAVAAIVPIAAAGYFGWHLIEEQRAKREFEAQRAALEHQRVVAQQMENEAQVRMAQAVVAAMRKDTETPPPQIVLDRCRQTVRGLSQDLGGWRLNKITCAPNGAGADVSYVLQGMSSGGIGTNGSLLYAAKEHFDTVPNIDFAGGQATLHVNGDAVPARQPIAPVQAPTYMDVLNNFVSHFQLVGQAYQDLHFKLDAPTPKSITYIDPALEKSNSEQKFKPVPPERSYRVGALMVFGQGMWMLDEVQMKWPFVTIQSIELTPTSEDQDGYRWTIQGTYVTAHS